MMPSVNLRRELRITPFAPLAPPRHRHVGSGGIFITALGRSLGWWLIGSILLGPAPAKGYPSLISTVSDASQSSWRARSITTVTSRSGCSEHQSHHLG